jgi:hypothetical protein
MLCVAVVVIVFSCPTVNGQDGSPVACGILQQTAVNVLSTSTVPMGGSNVSAGVTAISGIKSDDQVCFFGSADGLERELVSVMNDPAGPGCTAANGCGLNMHSGTACTDSSTMGGNFHSTTEDPWISTGYLSTSTDEVGHSTFFHCFSTGETTMDGRPFVIHADDGTPVSCGLLMLAEMADMADTYLGDMVIGDTDMMGDDSSAGKLVPFASALTMLTTAVIAAMFFKLPVQYRPYWMVAGD